MVRDARPEALFATGESGTGQVDWIQDGSRYRFLLRSASDGRLLAETEEPIANIALATGFSALSSFNQVFKETHGVPPRDYRLMHRGKRGSETLSPESVSDPLFPR